MVLYYPFVWPLWNAAENSQRQVCKTESYLEREHNVRRAVLGVGYATSGITANVLTLLLPPPNILARGQLNPYLQAARRKEVEQWQSGADHNVIANSLGMRRIDMDAERAFAKRGVHDFTIASATAPASA